MIFRIVLALVVVLSSIEFAQAQCGRGGCGAARGARVRVLVRPMGRARGGCARGACGR